MAIPLLIPFALLFGAMALLAIHHSLQTWMTSLLNSLSHPHGNFLTRVALKAVGFAAAGVSHIIRAVSSDVSHAAAAAMRPLADWLHALAGVVLSIPREINALSRDVEAAFVRLMHDVIRPLHRLANHALARAEHSISLIRKDVRELWRGIDRLHRDLAHEIRRTFHGIDALVRHTVLPRLRTAERKLAGVITRDLPALRRRERALEARLGRVEKALGLGIFGALIIRTLAKVAPWLFCRNWKKVGNTVCALPSREIDALLALLIGTIAIRDLRTLARFAEAIEQDIANEISRVLDV